MTRLTHSSSCCILCLRPRKRLPRRPNLSPLSLKTPIAACSPWPRIFPKPSTATAPPRTSGPSAKSSFTLPSGNAYAAKAGRGEKANWDEIDPKGYTTKAAKVALLEKTIADANATLKATPEDRWAKTVQPWLAVIEHAGEHYGQLVVYYRNNGMVPPESRPKK